MADLLYKELTYAVIGAAMEVLLNAIGSLNNSMVVI